MRSVPQNRSFTQVPSTAKARGVEPGPAAPGLRVQVSIVEGDEGLLCLFKLLQDAVREALLCGQVGQWSSLRL